MDKYIGFDIDSKKTVACVVEKDHKDTYATLPTDVQAMKNYLIEQGRGGDQVHLTFEVSGEAGYQYDSLADCVASITVSNPSKMPWIFRTTKKNDRIDARKQALLLSIGEIPAVHMPSMEVRQWRVMIQHRRKIVNRITAVKNRVRALLKGHGYRKAQYSGSGWKQANRFWMRRLSEAAGTSVALWPMTLGDMLDELALLEGQRDRATTRLDDYLDTQSGGRLLMSIPGVGPRTAEAVLAYTDDVRRFAGAKAYGGYFGMTPRLDESGSMRRLGHISKQGPSVVRWLIVESAWRAIRKSAGLRDFYERVMHGQASRKRVAIVAVARKMLTVIRAMLLTGEMFNESWVGRCCDGTKRPLTKQSA